MKYDNLQILDFNNWNALYDFIFFDYRGMGRISLMTHINILRYKAKEKIKTFKFSPYLKENNHQV